MAYRSTLKDLGVAQWVGKDAKDLAAKRHAVLQQRTAAVAKLAVPVAKAGYACGHLWHPGRVVWGGCPPAGLRHLELHEEVGPPCLL